MHTHTQVVPDYIDVEATSFASNFLPGGKIIISYVNSNLLGH